MSECIVHTYHHVGGAVADRHHQRQSQTMTNTFHICQEPQHNAGVASVDTSLNILIRVQDLSPATHTHTPLTV